MIVVLVTSCVKSNSDEPVLEVERPTGGGAAATGSDSCNVSGNQRDA